MGFGSKDNGEPTVRDTYSRYLLGLASVDTRPSLLESPSLANQSTVPLHPLPLCPRWPLCLQHHPPLSVPTQFMLNTQLKCLFSRKCLCLGSVSDPHLSFRVHPPHWTEKSSRAGIVSYTLRVGQHPGPAVLRSHMPYTPEPQFPHLKNGLITPTPQHRGEERISEAQETSPRRCPGQEKWLAVPHSSLGCQPPT